MVYPGCAAIGMVEAAADTRNHRFGPHKKVLDNTSEVCYNGDEINSNAEYAEETPVQDMELPVAQTNTAENSTETIGRKKDTSPRKLYIHRVSENGETKVYCPYAPIQCNIHFQNETQRKAVHDEVSIGHCHSPP